MACTISERAEIKLREAGVVTQHFVTSFFQMFLLAVVVITSSQTHFQFRDGGVWQQNHGPYPSCPKPVLLLGTNVIKHILCEYKQCDAYWEAVSTPCSMSNPEAEQFLSMLAVWTVGEAKSCPTK